MREREMEEVAERSIGRPPRRAAVCEIEEVDEDWPRPPPRRAPVVSEIELVEEASSSRPPMYDPAYKVVDEGTSSRPLRYAPSSRPPVPAASSSSPGASAGAAEPSGASGGGGAAVQHFDSESLPHTLMDVRPLLRAANQLEAESPRVAFLCRFHALEKANTIDPDSEERGARQFKTALLLMLHQDDKVTALKRKETDDAREIKSFYEKKKQANAHDHVVPVLAEVLKAVLSSSGLESRDMSCDRQGQGLPYHYNILPLTSSSRQKPIMLLPEIKVAVSAVFNVHGLPLATITDETSCTDIFLWLQSWFGFQRGNVANQREHLILLLANIHARLNPNSQSAAMLDDRAVDELSAKTFDNYLTWCKRLERLSNIWLVKEVQNYKLLYVALYLLIWGEAANLRLMPECLCYIFHHMSYELYGVLSGAESIITGEKVIPAYGGEDESFLNNVVTPIYKEIEAEMVKNKNGVSDHSKWRNYDDINEFFWSADCFKLGWPMRLNNDFFFSSIFFNSAVPEQTEQRWLGKTNFVEVRSFLHLFRSFDRMWTLLVLGLQILIIMAWHGLESPLQLLDPIIFEDILSIFITNAALRVIQVIVDIAFSWRTKDTMGSSQKLRFSIKFCFAVTWSIILPIFYSTSARCPHTFLGMFCLSKYMVAVALFLTNNVIGMALFFIPCLWSYIETSTWRICRVLSWWCQPQLYVGRGMHEGKGHLLKYTAFWMVLLPSKFLFSYYFEIKPLVEATKKIMRVDVNTYAWHELFPQVKSNTGVILALWAPIITVYCMDTQIWYSVFFSIFGGMSGIVRHIGEIRTMEMVRSRFCTLPQAFNASLVPSSTAKVKNRISRILSCSRTQNVSTSERDDPTKFALVWNQIINSFRLEDLISNRELDLMTMPMSLESTSWPLFVLAEKFSKSVDMAANFTGNSSKLFRKIKKDNNMFCAIKDFQDLTISVFSSLVIGDVERRVITSTFAQIEKSIQNSSLLTDFRLDHLPEMVDKVHRLVELLYKNKEDLHREVTKLLQDIIDILIQDMLVDAQSILDQINLPDKMISDDDGASIYYQPELFVSTNSISKISFPLPDSGPLKEQVKRLYLLLNTKERAVDVPSNLEARRRVSFFATSLFMNMPAAPQVRSMLSFSIITPYFTEEVNFSEEELHSNQDETSILSYMQKIYPDEWRNFLERLGTKVTNEEIRYWASFRGQTLSRTVRGMMYNRKAIRLQAFLDKKNYQDLCEGPLAAEGGENKSNINHSLSTELDALAELKFSYVIACQMFGEYKSSNDPRAQDIIDLMTRYPALRVAYIEEKETIIGNIPCTVYSSVLIKAENNLDQEIYRIKLPGAPIIGEGKPEIQDIATIFTRGEALQTINMNQDNYLEEAYKMRNLLQEFARHHRYQTPTVLGLKEHIFTGSASSLGEFISYQATGFVTLNFTGYNSIFRGHVSYSDYIRIGKGRDARFNEISRFEGKVASDNGEKTISRDIYRLGQRFGFFRMLSFYYTTVGFYFNNLVSVVGVYLFLYGQLYTLTSGLQKGVLKKAEDLNMKSIETALSCQYILQLGLLTGLPTMMELGLERGFGTALSEFVIMQLQAGSVFFSFSLGTKSHYYGRNILHGDAKYRPTGRKFMSFRASFRENYQLYSRTHFVKGFELIFLLTIYHIFMASHVYGIVHMITTYSMWFMALAWLFAPSVFNPAGFSWHKIVDDWAEWKKWMSCQGGIGVEAEKSWESWWIAENSHLRHSSLNSRISEVFLSSRFFLLQYVLVYSINVIEHKTFLVYLISWIIMIVIVVWVKLGNWANRRWSSDHQLIFRVVKILMFLSVLTCLILLSHLYKFSIMDLIIACLAFIPAGWGILAIVQVLRPKIEDYMIWEPMQIIAHTYDYVMGTMLFVALSVLAWIPVIPATQTRVLFRKTFSRQPEILPFIRALAKTKRR